MVGGKVRVEKKSASRVVLKKFGVRAVLLKKILNLFNGIYCYC